MKKFVTLAFALLIFTSVIHIPAHAVYTASEAIQSIKGLGTSH